MSRGYGRVQNGCQAAIDDAERAGEPPPTTYDIAADVYRVERDDDGYRYVSDAQHVAVKRALAGLERQGKVIGLAWRYCRDEWFDDYRSLWVRCWFSERGAQRWVREQDPKRESVKTFKARMRAIGMKPE
jgi:hypothetical protein